jgi:hypothetical protein
MDILLHSAPCDGLTVLDVGGTPALLCGAHLQRLIYYSNYDPSNFGYFGRNPFGLVGKPYHSSD